MFAPFQSFVSGGETSSIICACELNMETVKSVNHIKLKNVKFCVYKCSKRHLIKKSCNIKDNTNCFYIPPQSMFWSSSSFYSLKSLNCT